MSSPSSPALQRLHRLDTTSPNFGDQLCDVLYGQEYQQCVPNLQDHDPLWLVDYLDKVLDGLDPSSLASRKCLRELRNVCGNRGILPTSYTLSADFLDIGSYPLDSGGYGDVYLGVLGGSNVSVKRVRMYVAEGPQKVTKTFCKEAVMWKRLKHPNIVPLLGVTITPLQLISTWMPGGNLPEYIRTHPNADRLAFLREATRGLIYMHDKGVVHGDIKGANIMIDKDGHAHLAEFSLITLISDQSTFVSSCIESGTLPWMSPELLDPERFGLKKRRPTRESDCYALGMVIYEILSGQVPFATYGPFGILTKVLRGEHPKRPQGERGKLLTDGIWEIVELCWKRKPGDRASAKDVLRCLGGASLSSRPSLDVDGEVESDSDDQSDATSSDS
ncbi:kinase-like protein [Thelephora ganbajun]|uniref:Kinase-like protein n=1 Tax=Thelephora ganbajun TaxID=370292 RepID=A0ACB6Z2Z9_THEGA|nr:kinase-like protein [Thelephora ganbajun]